MTARFIVAASLAASVACLGLTGTASAQSYYGGSGSYDRGYQDNRYSDPCRDDGQAAGAVIGGGLGAVAGSQMAARGRRTEGSILGAVVGAMVGAAAGSSSNRSSPYCDNGYYGDSRYQYDNRYYSNDRYDNRAYDNRYGGYNDQRYYGNDRYNGRYSTGSSSYYGDRSYSGYGNSYGGSSYGCTRVESTSRDRYGRLVTTYREVC